VLEKPLPLALLPLGTANNIAKTLGISGHAETIVKSWVNPKVLPFDVAKIDGIKGASFFLEGFGYGLFPKLIREMEKQEEHKINTREKSLRTALDVLHDLVNTYEAKKCRIMIDDVDYSGRFLLVEIMNIQSIGPNLNLAPMAHPGDGELEVVLIHESERAAFASYVMGKIKGSETPSSFNILKAKKLQIMWGGNHLHVDDRNYELKGPKEITIEVRPGLLQFYI